MPSLFPCESNTTSLAHCDAVGESGIHPIFSGQNSRLFQLASHLSYPLRVALIFHETRRRIGRPAQIRIGAPVTAEALSALDREQVAADLRRRCMTLAAPALSDPDETYVWPSHIKW